MQALDILLLCLLNTNVFPCEQEFVTVDEGAAFVNVCPEKYKKQLIKTGPGIVHATELPDGSVLGYVIGCPEEM